MKWVPDFGDPFLVFLRLVKLIFNTDHRLRNLYRI